MKKKLITAAVFCILSVAAASGAYFMTTCGKGGMTIDKGSMSDEDWNDFLIELNEIYCGKGSGKAWLPNTTDKQEPNFGDNGMLP